MNVKTEIDGFRFINNLHTTVRQLFICSKIVRLLGKRQLPFELLKDEIITWSYKEEEQSEIYRNSKGKLTEINKKASKSGGETSSLKRYLVLCDSMGLIVNLNGYYSNTRLGHLLFYFLENKMGNDSQLDIYEKIFYSQLLLNIDADGILLVFQLLFDKNLRQSEIQDLFKIEFNKRLNAKQYTSDFTAKSLVSEKYRTLNFTWQKPDIYAEHILIPRCEWLNSLGFVQIERKGNSTFYCISPIGNELYNSFNIIDTTNSIRDINYVFLQNHFFSVICKIGYLNIKKYFIDLTNDEQKMLIGRYLEEAIKVIKTSSTFRLPLKESLIFLTIEISVKEQILVNNNEIVNLLKNELTYNNKQYQINDLGRPNESYVITRLLI
jgi:hypothetical protein